jgi:hypothetical protein
MSTGRPSTPTARRTRLTIHDWLTLFLKLCAAVHDAHQHLVIHGDLKPATSS